MSAHRKVIAAFLLLCMPASLLPTAAAFADDSPRTIEYCPPLIDGSACSNTPCSNGNEVCTPRCVRLSSQGQVTVLECDCRLPSECHVEVPPFATPYCAGNCPPAQYCVQNVVVTELGDGDVCCDCVPIQCNCPGDIDGNGTLNALDIAGFIRAYLGQPDYLDNGGCADLDGDGYSTMTDVPFLVLLILQKAVCPETPCCPRADLTVNLATGVDDQNNLIPDSSPDDNWEIVAEAPNTYGSIPRPATVTAPHVFWQTFAGTKWVTNEYFADNGDYEYQFCFCLDPRFKNPLLSFKVRADDVAEIYLNNIFIGNAATFESVNPPTINVTNPGFFISGQNCLKIVVHNIGGAPTGINLTGTFTATDGKCCCPPADLNKDITSGVYDGSGGMLIPMNVGDDTWTLITDPNGGSVPRAPVVNPYSGWFTMGGSQWISPTQQTVLPGVYVYQYCFCLDPRFQFPVLNLFLRADYSATIWLNGVQVGATTTYRSFESPSPSHVFVTDSRLFRPCLNCIEIRVTNEDGGGSPTGMNVVGSIAAQSGLCCDDRTYSCCYAQGACSTLLPGETQCLGGGVMHAGGCEQQGCCLPNGGCQMLHPACCRFIGGQVLPSETPCLGQIRACCVPGPGGPCSTCVNTDPACCIAKYGGTPQGPGSSCQP